MRAPRHTTPQSNGKIERWHRILKEEWIRSGTPLTLEDARRIVGKFVEYYNTVRLHSAIGYLTPKDKLEGREQEIFDARDRKLEAARERRKEKRHAARQAALDGQPAVATTQYESVIVPKPSRTARRQDSCSRRTNTLKNLRAPSYSRTRRLAMRAAT